jgi:hypothetical protein
LLLLVASTWWPSQALGHTRSQSASSWEIQGRIVTVEFVAAAVDVTRLGDPRPLPAVLGAHLRETLQVASAAGTCHQVGSVGERPAAPEYLRLVLRYECPGVPDAAWVGAFFDVVPGHAHLARVGANAPEAILTHDRRRVVLSDPAALPAADRLRFYFVSGVTHILAGLDHLAFLAALLLLTRRFSDLVGAVTGFTVGHSVTLGLAAFGSVTVDVRLIEILIAWTIVLLALEVGLRSGASLVAGMLTLAVLSVLLVLARLLDGGVPWMFVASVTVAGASALVLLRRIDTVGGRVALTAAFGLIHGFGFAQALRDVGLPDDSVLPALLAFNVGVEVGQLVLVVPAALALSAMRAKTPASHDLLVRAASVALCAAGTWWFAARAIGPG